MSLPALSPYGYVVGKRMRQGDVGWDVRALQLGLTEVGHALIADGNYGPITKAAVTNFQSRLGLVADGWAGNATQRQLAFLLIWPVQRAQGIPRGLMRGQNGHESS